MKFLENSLEFIFLEIKNITIDPNCYRRFLNCLENLEFEEKSINYNYLVKSTLKKFRRKRSNSMILTSIKKTDFLNEFPENEVVEKVQRFKSSELELNTNYFLTKSKF